MEEEEGEGRQVFPPGGRRPDGLEVILVKAEIEKFRKEGLEIFIFNRKCVGIYPLPTKKPPESNWCL